MKQNYLYINLIINYKNLKFYILIFLLFICIYLLKNFNRSKPKISIFLPIYNKENYLIKSIQCLQNQTLKDIEIVAVNDCSSDKSLKTIIDLSKADKRIKVVNNDKNHGLLYSRAMGILHSSGEYIMNLDPDDELNDNECLEYLYNQTITSNIDIISFNILNKKNNETINCTNFNIVERQPELFNNIFDKDYVLNDFLIWNKLIKKNIYIKAYKDLQHEIYNGKWNYHEDLIWSILVNRYAKSKLCLDRLVYIYNYNNNSLMNKRNWNLEFQNAIYFLNTYKKLFNSKKEEKYLKGGYLWQINNLRPGLEECLLIDDNNIKNNITKIAKLFFKFYNRSRRIRHFYKQFFKSYKI